MPPLRFLVALLTLAAGARAESMLDSAQSLMRQRKFAEARAILEKLLQSEPNNAAAYHHLGLAVKGRGDTAAYEEAVPWLAKSAELEPENAEYLADYGGTLLQLASRTNSLSAATKGRDAMEKAVVLKPDYVDAHEGLFQFYQRAPWPLGSSSKAAAHLAAIRRVEPDRATALSVTAKINAKDFAAAFQLCAELLAKHPDDYVALYNYGRTAAMSGLNLAAGQEHLQRCLQLEPPSPASPSHSYVWLRMGTIEQQLGHTAKARADFETALKLDSSNKQAVEALAKLR